MKIIIVGCGKVGTTLAEQLNRENHDITLIDTDDEALKNISDNVDLMSVTGNGAIYQVQMEAGIQEAEMMIATTNSDELNMLCCLIAKKQVTAIPLHVSVILNIPRRSAISERN